METRLQSHYESLSRVIGLTHLAEGGAGVVLFLQFVLAGVLAILLLDQLDPAIAKDPVGTAGIAVTLVGMTYILSALAAVGLVVWVYVPVVSVVRVYVPATPKTGRSLIYFADIAELGFQKFIVAAMGMDAAEIEPHLQELIYRISRIASGKMRRVRYAFWLSGVSIITGIILLAWGGPS